MKPDESMGLFFSTIPSIWLLAFLWYLGPKVTNDVFEHWYTVPYYVTVLISMLFMWIWLGVEIAVIIRKRVK